ncbi:hypothetical protein PSH28_18435 [Pseudomonas resinovorans]|uniref:hypothetical protein n=1 Tax=Metapseudomonas resinovorans TaxID=53412 RepID=UPI00237F66A7|nr:hypothetical protein [Pseudomonas resinovorans]MDE3738586.1 hypothetical protein [Pseudomonas resinovorans]
MSFKLHMDDLADLSVNDVIRRIESQFKIPLGELKLFDLLVDEERNTAMRHGAYMFFDGRGECIYIGMCSSSHFAHRIGGHFGMSPKYGMNTFLKRTVKTILGLEDKYPSYVSALPRMADYRLLLIGTDSKSKVFIRRLEKLLHIIYRPKLNFPKGFPITYKPVNLGENFALSIASQ